MKKIEHVFLLLASLFIGLSLVVMPVTEVPDEVVHAKLAWELLYDNEPGAIDWAAQNDVINNPQPADADVNMGKYRKFFTEKVTFPDNLNVKIGFHNIGHLPQLLGMLIGQKIYPSLGVVMTLGRLLNALVYIIGIYFCLKYLKFGKNILAFVSLLPMMVQQAASLSYDVLNHVFVAAFFTFFVNLTVDRKMTNKRLLYYLLIAIGLYGVKKNNLLLLPFIFLIDFEFKGLLERFNPFLKFLQKHRLKLIGLAIVVGLAVGLYLVGQRMSIKHFFHMLYNTLLLNHVNGALNTFLSVGIFGFFGWLTLQLPLWIIFIDIVVMTLLYFDEEQVEVPKLVGVGSALIYPLQALAIIIGMYFAWTPKILGENANISVGTQGRYFTPFLIFFSPLFISLRHKIQMALDKSFLRKLLIGTLLLNYIVFIILITVYYWT